MMVVVVIVVVRDEWELSELSSEREILVGGVNDGSKLPVHPARIPQLTEGCIFRVAPHLPLPVHPPEDYVPQGIHPAVAQKKALSRPRPEIITATMAGPRPLPRSSSVVCRARAMPRVSGSLTFMIIARTFGPTVLLSMPANMEHTKATG